MRREKFNVEKFRGPHQKEEKEKHNLTISMLPWVEPFHFCTTTHTPTTKPIAFS